MKSNYAFLTDHFPELATIGSLAEDYLHSDSNSCIIKLGLFGETIVNRMMEFDGVAPPETDNTHANRIKALKREGLLTPELDDLLYGLRKARNRAVHEGYGSFAEAAMLLEMGFKLGVWFMQVYGDWAYQPQPFVLPPPVGAGKEQLYPAKAKAALKAWQNQQKAEAQALKKSLAEKEAQIEALKQQAAKTDQLTPATRPQRAKQAQSAASQLTLSEAETRYLIDIQLQKVGWDADTVNLTYASGARPQMGKNQAIAEWPTDFHVSTSGYADYALFVGEKLVGIIEAKRSALDIPGVIDYQCKSYAQTIREADAPYLIGNWHGYKAPFLFATNGRKYLKQLETKSGIWFRDVRNDANIPRALQGWMSPEGIMELLERDLDAANGALAAMSRDFLSDKNGLNLRPYQIEAIVAAETAVREGRDKVLLSMATGTGKTRTILGLIYRFLKSGRFKRILFLVDRSALGEQAQDVFREVRLEDLLTLDAIYNIKNLEDRSIDKETRIHVATVQSLVKRILYNEEDTIPAVSDYDLIVVDEAHRGYILDKELGEDEILYRSQDDFISKYRAVIDYFDAVKVAMTATPALHTSEIFGPPVFSYSYREAVIEGYLVDHDAPHTLTTKLSTGGIVYHPGDTLVIYDPVTGDIVNSDQLEDELKFEVEQFNRQVITESFNRTVLAEIANDLDPEGEGKTLVFAVDDNHADLIVKILKELYEPMGVDNDAILKITGSVGGGNKKKVLEAIKHFKNEKYPNIAVTVDLLTTGIDVPEITTLIFMRRVKSRILFEQMLGRATRLCPAIGKTHFDIYDPVGVYEALEPYNTMKPVVKNPSTSFEDLLAGLAVLPTEAQQKNQIEMILAKLQRGKGSLDETARAQFASLCGGDSPEQFIKTIRKLPVAEAKAKLQGAADLFAILKQNSKAGSRPVVISDAADELLGHTRGYGAGSRPEDYLDAFKVFINDNKNKIMALKIVCTSPGEMTRESLKSLKLELDRHQFTEAQLNSALKAVTNEDIAADIISLIRQQALGSALVSHEDRIKNAMARLKKQHHFSKMEENWLARIEKNLLAETILEPDTFNTGAFKDHGGFDKINKVFKNQLGQIITELNQYLYDDGGNAAS
ncbi:type I restriction-modification system endonuclease [Acetobacterium wieringae]|uniref:type I restriction-modification system endonuclease n=1 Tax=Acetobacterium wieringae TaxID=52694 RepID=UPI002034810B|nr:type I restriction-modification system endonuclease [Acetobacterium wieringae]URN83744.1 type I restriction-modification system endonuclease [Acetobacterium wieringae]